MAKIKQGIFGGFSGKIGNVIGSSWKGINVMKIMPTSVANPKTAAQVANRGRFTYATAFAKVILLAIVKPLNDRAAQLMSGYNKFVKQSIEAFNSSGLNDLSKIVISTGRIAPAKTLVVTGAAGQKQLDLEWAFDETVPTALATDKAYILIVNKTNGEVATSSAEFVRAEEAGEVSFPSNMTAGDDVGIYIAFTNTLGESGPQAANIKEIE